MDGWVGVRLLGGRVGGLVGCWVLGLRVGCLGEALRENTSKKKDERTENNQLKTALIEDTGVSGWVVCRVAVCFFYWREGCACVINVFVLGVYLFFLSFLISTVCWFGVVFFFFVF